MIDAVNNPKGRCRPCNRAYVWTRKAHRNLQTVRCPQCGRRLGQTIHYQRAVPWTELQFTPGEDDRMKAEYRELTAWRKARDAYRKARELYAREQIDQDRTANQYGGAYYTNAYYQAQKEYDAAHGPEPKRPTFS